MNNTDVKILLNVIDNYLKKLGPYLENDNNNDLEYHEFALETLIYRHYSTINTLNKLLPDFFSRGNYMKFPISCILRASVLDCIHIIFFLEHFEKSENADSIKYDIVINSFLREQVEIFKDDILKSKQLGLFGNDDYTEIITDLDSKMKYLYTKGYKEKIGKSTSFYMLNYIQNSKITPYKSLYNKYAVLSKIEHFGILSQLILKDVENYNETIIGSICAIFDTTMHCLIMLGRDVSFIMELKENVLSINKINTNR